MSRQINFTNEEIQKIIDLYTNPEQHFGARKIGSIMGVSESVINRILKENNIKKRNLQEANGKSIPKDLEQIIIDNYTIHKMGLASAGKQYGFSQYQVTKLLKDKGIEIRNYTEAKQEGRKYPCDDNFFKNQTADMAYILGLLASDGNISKKENAISIELIREDKPLLEKIRQITKSQRPIKDYHRQNNNIDVSKFVVWSKEWKNDLSKYNIIPNKTFILQPPTFLQSQYFIDYIRGYFDGDGSVYRHGNFCTWEIIGASKSLITWVRQILATQYGITCNNIRLETLQNGTKIYRIAYYDKDTVLRIYNTIYNTSSILYMERKKVKFNSFLNIPRDSNPL